MAVSRCVALFPLRDAATFVCLLSCTLFLIPLFKVIFMISESTAAYEAICEITPPTGDEELPTAVVVSCEPLGEGFQPLLSPDDCELAEQIVKLDAGVAKLLEERYGVTDIGENREHAGSLFKDGMHTAYRCITTYSSST